MLPFIRLGLSFSDATDILRTHATHSRAAGVAQIRTEPVQGRLLEGDATHRYLGLSGAGTSCTYHIDRPELTDDMAESIVRYFEPMQRLGILLIESNELGLWFVGPTNRRLFIGLARLPDRSIETDIVPAGARRSEGAICKLH